MCFVKRRKHHESENTPNVWRAQTLSNAFLEHNTSCADDNGNTSRTQPMATLQSGSIFVLRIRLIGHDQTDEAVARKRPSGRVHSCLADRRSQKLARPSRGLGSATLEVERIAVPDLESTAWDLGVPAAQRRRGNQSHRLRAELMDFVHAPCINLASALSETPLIQEPLGRGHQACPPGTLLCPDKRRCCAPAAIGTCFRHAASAQTSLRVRAVLRLQSMTLER